MKQDLRVIKSKAAIENAFVTLLEIHSFDNVSIKEIAEKAMVNRNTIYLNYGSKEGILETIVKDSFLKYFGDLSSDTFKKISFSKKGIEQIFKNLFSVLNENIELYRTILTDRTATGYLQTEADKLRKLAISRFKPTTENEIKFSFIISGVWGVVNSYVVYAKGTEEENIKILTDLVYTNLRHLSFLR